MLEVRDLHVHFDVSKRGKGRSIVKAVNGVSFAVGKGDAVGLVGESGSGKSTIGKAVLHLVPVTSGQILLDGDEMTVLTRARERTLRRRAQMIFQDPHSALNPRIQILHSVAEPLVLHTRLRGTALRLRVATLLDTVGLARQFLYRYPHELSGGQKQRVCIARAIALEPELLILDEPTSALDVSVQAQILEFLKSLQAELDLSYLFISHNLAVVRNLCDQVVVLYLGEIVEEAPAQLLFDRPRHPYTVALLGAVPYPRARQPARRKPLSGDIPSPIDRPQGCNFASRCPSRIDGLCEVTAPALITLANGHRVACHLEDAPDSGHGSTDSGSARPHG